MAARKSRKKAAAQKPARRKTTARKAPARKPTPPRKGRAVTTRSKTGRKAPGKSAARSGGGDWARLTAADIMQPQVVTVATTTPLSEVEQVLSDHRISGVPVTDEAGHIVGVLSVRDLIERYAQDPDARPRRGGGFFAMSNNELDDDDIEAFELPPEAEETAGELMTAEVFAVPATAGMAEVARAMVTHSIHRILVHRNGTTVGIVSTSDILRALAR